MTRQRKPKKIEGGYNSPMGVFFCFCYHDSYGEGTKFPQVTSEAFAGVAESINQVVINNQRITHTAQQQVFAIQQVVEAMNSLNLVAKETATGISQVKIGTEDLSQTAQTLKRIIELYSMIRKREEGRRKKEEGRRKN